ncbi:MAG: hypothetical protein WCH09_05465, partial [Bacteroidota bacterium]
ISSAVTTSIYGLLKGSIHLYKNYYLKSSCHDNSLTIEIVTTVPPLETVTHVTDVTEEKKDEAVDAL